MTLIYDNSCGLRLIADIIEHAPHLKDENINLVLQPMSKADVLREYLFSNGFEILKERYVTDTGKHYVCILARFSAVNTPFTDADVSFGKRSVFFDAVCPELKSYMELKRESLLRASEGKRLGGLDNEKELSLLAELNERMKLI